MGIIGRLIGLRTREEKDEIRRENEIWYNSDEYKKQQNENDYKTSLKKYYHKRTKAMRKENMRRYMFFKQKNIIKELSEQIQVAHKKNDKELEIELIKKRDKAKKELMKLSKPIDIPEKPIWSSNERAPDESSYQHHQRTQKTSSDFLSSSENKYSNQNNQINLSKEQQISNLEKDIKIEKLEKELAELKKSQDPQN